MEAISAIGISLALGAAVGKEVVSVVVKDAYAALKDRVSKRYPSVSVVQLEEAPASEDCRAVVEEDLATAGADRDSELVAAAHKLTELVQLHSPGTAVAIGIDLKDVEAASLRLSAIIASGTGVKVNKGKFTGDINISDVRAGTPPGGPTKVS